MIRLLEDTQLVMRLTRNLIHYGLITLAILCSVVGACEGLANIP
jgi:hypothetical protein